MGEDDEDVFEGERKSPGRSRPPESSPGPEPKGKLHFGCDTEKLHNDH